MRGMLITEVTVNYLQVTSLKNKIGGLLLDLEFDKQVDRDNVIETLKDVNAELQKMMLS